MKNLSLKAILVAFAADFAVSQMLATVASLVAIFAMPQARALMSNPTGLATFLSNWTPFLVMGLVCACVGEVVGGFVAGLLAPLDAKRNALAAAGLTVIISLALTGSYALWYRIAAIALIVPCYWLGALLAMRRNAAKAGSATFAGEGAPLAPPR
jgi:hypothetical protein